jgi:hypothetical protein
MKRVSRCGQVLFLSAILFSALLCDKCESSCVQLWDGYSYVSESGALYYGRAGLVLSDGSWFVRFDYRYDTCCSWSVILPLPQDGEIVGITLDRGDKAVYLSYADGKAFKAQGFVECEDVCVPPGGWELVQDWGYSGDCYGSDPAGLSSGGTHGVTSESPLVGLPNPARTSTTLHFELQSPGQVNLAIYDASGKRVATLVDSDLPAGDYSINWDANDALGEPVASGVYFARVISAGRIFRQKILVVR